MANPLTDPQTNERDWWRLILPAIGVVIVAAYLFPVYWMYISGFKLSGEIFSNPPTFYPHRPSLDSMIWIFERGNVWRYLINSFIIAGSVTVLTLVLGAGGAYALGRLRSAWIDAMLLLVMVFQVFPQALMATPMFVIFRQVDLINTLTAVILATTTKTLPFALIMLRPIFLQVPLELEEAARVDGCTRLGALVKVVLPLVRSGMIVVGTLSFLLAYGEFIYPASFLTARELQPATVGLYDFIGAEYADWNNVMAFASLFVTPVVLLFLVLQRKIVAGLTAGALK